MLRWTYCLCTLGEVVHTLNEGEDVGDRTSLACEIYVLILILMQDDAGICNGILPLEDKGRK